MPWKEHLNRSLRALFASAGAGWVSHWAGLPTPLIVAIVVASFAFYYWSSWWRARRPPPLARAEPLSKSTAGMDAFRARIRWAMGTYWRRVALGGGAFYALCIGAYLVGWLPLGDANPLLVFAAGGAASFCYGAVMAWFMGQTISDSRRSGRWP
jgi:hypothetical protein